MHNVKVLFGDLPKDWETASQRNCSEEVRREPGYT